jgi:lysophospholipase L1-like esterase
MSRTARYAVSAVLLAVLTWFADSAAGNTSLTSRVLLVMLVVWLAVAVVCGLWLLAGYASRRPVASVNPEDPWALNPRSPARGMVSLGATVAACAFGVVIGLATYFGVFGPASADPISGDLSLAKSAQPGLRVLFIGDSLTSWNSMITMVSDLAAANRRDARVYAVEYAPGGSTLADAERDPRLQRLLRSAPWDEVVLQDQSQDASEPWLTESVMYPSAKALIAIAVGVHARPVLFMTWAWRSGDGKLAHDDRSAMQNRLNAAYTRLGTSLGVPVVPVGAAWSDAESQLPQIQLWQPDGVHPTQAGSYLAACELYYYLLGRSPVGNTYTARLGRTEAESLQAIAAVLGPLHRASSGGA